MHNLVKICCSWNVDGKSIGARDKILKKDYKKILKYIDPKFYW